MKEKIVVVGAGGHSRSLIDVLELEAKYEILGILDTQMEVSELFCGYKVLGDDSMFEELIKDKVNFAIGIGQIKSPSVRKNIFNRLVQLNAKLPAIISPRAYVSKSATIGKGSSIFHDVLINANAKVADNVIINSKALIEHDCEIECDTHIAVAAVLSGGVKVGGGSFIGAGSVIRECVNIGANVIVGSGVVVKHDVSAGIIK